MNEGDLSICLVSHLKQSHEGTCSPFQKESGVSFSTKEYISSTPWMRSYHRETEQTLFGTQEAQLSFVVKLISIYLGNYIQFVVYKDTDTCGELGLRNWTISCETTGPCQLSKHLTSEYSVCYFIFNSWSRFSPALWGQPLVSAIIYSCMSTILMTGTSKGLQRETLFSSLMNTYSSFNKM